MVPFPPVVEPANTKGAFMTKHPREQYHSKAHALDIPLMIGVTYDEGTIKTAGKALEVKMDLIQMHVKCWRRSKHSKNRLKTLKLIFFYYVHSNVCPIRASR